MTAPRLTCQLPQVCLLHQVPSGKKCGYEADSYSELRAHMGAAHKSR